MDPVDAIQGASILVPVWFASLAASKRRDADDLCVALALFNVWAACLALRFVVHEALMMPDPDRVMTYLYSPIDVAFGLYVALLHRQRPETWKVAVIMLTGVQFAAHVLYGWWDFQQGEVSKMITRGYIGALNVTFFAQVASGSWPGGFWLVARMGRWVRSRFPQRRSRANGVRG